MEAYQNKITQILAIVLEVPTEQIDEASSPDTIVSWDSIKHMNLVIALEEEFDIEFTDNEIIEMMNYKLICNIVQSKKNSWIQF